LAGASRSEYPRIPEFDASDPPAEKAAAEKAAAEKAAAEKAAAEKAAAEKGPEVRER